MGQGRSVIIEVDSLEAHLKEAGRLLLHIPTYHSQSFVCNSLSAIPDVDVVIPVTADPFGMLHVLFMSLRFLCSSTVSTSIASTLVRVRILYIEP